MNQNYEVKKHEPEGCTVRESATGAFAHGRCAYCGQDIRMDLERSFCGNPWVGKTECIKRPISQTEKERIVKAIEAGREYFFNQFCFTNKDSEKESTISIYQKDILDYFSYNDAIRHIIHCVYKYVGDMSYDDCKQMFKAVKEYDNTKAVRSFIEEQLSAFAYHFQLSVSIGAVGYSVFNPNRNNIIQAFMGGILNSTIHKVLTDVNDLI